MYTRELDNNNFTSRGCDAPDDHLRTRRLHPPTEPRETDCGESRGAESRPRRGPPLRDLAHRRER